MKPTITTITPPDEIDDAITESEGATLPIEGKMYLCKLVNKFSKHEHVTILDFRDNQWWHQFIGIPMTETYVVTKWKSIDEIFN